MDSYKLTGKLSPELASYYQDLAAIANSAFARFADDDTQITCSFAPDARFNASVTKHNDRYHISINAAVHVILNFTFNHLMRDTAFFTGFGELQENMSGEFEHGIPLTLPTGHDITELVNNVLGISRPVCELRATMAYGLGHLATSFTIYHEVAHVLLGHVASLSSLADQASMEFIEFDDHEPDVDLTELRLIWEYEADVLAMMMCLSDVLSPHNDEFLASCFQISPEATSDRICVLVCAITTLFLIENQFFKDKTYRTHPAPNVRMTAAVTEVYNFMRQYRGEQMDDESELEQNIDAVLQMTTECWAKICPNDDEIINYDDPDMQFQAIEFLERKRQELCHLYRENAQVYPFLKV